jgi:FtsP/CotA-like multicopper oxidase with cupredoxin domain
MSSPCWLFAILLGGTAGKDVHFDWTIAERETMVYGQHRAYMREGILFFHNSSSNTGDAGSEHRVPSADVPSVLVADGFHRSVPTINGMLPGPTIEVEEGDTVVVHMKNSLANAATTIHWHGMYMRGTPWMDGVSQVTQCAVLPGESFTYRFVADPAGTHFYHAHHGVQRPDGLNGALIVRPKKPAPVRAAASASGAACAGGEWVLHLAVWQHADSQSLYTQRNGAGWYPAGPEAAPWKWTRDVSGKLVGEIPMQSGLVNGRGRFEGASSTANLTTFAPLVGGGSFCFRAIGSQEGKALRLSVDGHSLTVRSTDGAPVESAGGFESVVIFPGETFDVSVVPLPAVRVAAGALFWVRASTLEEGYANHTARAIVRYRDGGADQSAAEDAAADDRPELGLGTYNGPDPTTHPLAGGRVLNCPFPDFGPLASGIECVAIDSLRAAAGTPPVPGGNVTEIFLNFGFEPSINNRHFVTPAAPPLTQPPEEALPTPCDDAACDTSAFPREPCECTHTRPLPLNASVQLVLTNLGPGAFGMHPAHLHGHSFRVLRVGYPPVYNDTRAVCKWPAGAPHPECLSTDEITCAEGTGCAVAGWRGGAPPAGSLNFHRPPVKDTVVIPPGGYAVVRFRADNPGLWHLHCHMAHHLQAGMGMLLNEAPELHKHFPPPAGFPRCGSLADSGALQRHVADARGRWEELAGKLTR